MASSRSPIDRVSSAWRAPNTSAMAPMRPCISACACMMSAMRDFGVARLLGGFGRGNRPGARRTPQRDDERDEQRHEQQRAEAPAHGPA